MLVRCVTMLLLPLLACCATSAPQFRYYTLDMTPRAQLDAPVELAEVRIRVNQALARPEILVRTSPTSIEYYALDRWASGLDEQIAEKLKTEFAAQNGRRTRAVLDGLLMAFEQVDSPSGAEARVKLDATVDVETPDGVRTVFNKLYSQTQPSSAASPAAVVEALSRAVEAIAVQVAADIESAIQGASTPATSN